MAKPSSSLSTLFGRLLKVVIVLVVIPFAAALLLGILDQLNLVSLSGATYREWVVWGAATYTGVHLLLYRPTGLFRASHRLFSALAVSLFGGQVASVGGAGGGGGKGKGTKGSAGDSGTQGSTLVAFSPYVVPLYAVLVCAAGWALGRWADRAFVDGPVSFLIGTAMAFHWIMAADDLQRQRDRWHVETYLLAIGLVFVLTLLIGGACLPWAVPEFSFLRALADGLSNAQTIYTTLIQRLFL